MQLKNENVIKDSFAGGGRAMCSGQPLPVLIRPFAINPIKSEIIHHVGLARPATEIIGLTWCIAVERWRERETSLLYCCYWTCRLRKVNNHGTLTV